MIKKACVVGNNTKKSLSPIIFNYWFKKYNIVGQYGYLEVDEENFKRELKKKLQDKNLCGLNITVPYKEKIIKFISEVDEHSKSIGAVNCLTKLNDKVLGNNTDWLGFQNSILYLKNGGLLTKQIKKYPVVVLGYGGSAKAVIYALEKMGCAKVILWNRSFNKIKNLENLGNLKLLPKELKNKKFYIDSNTKLIINTIPTNISCANIKKQSQNIVKKEVFGYDLVYNKKTNFLDLFAPMKQIDGINLLVHQAAPCFEKWFKIKPEINIDLFNLVYKKLSEIK